MLRTRSLILAFLLLIGLASQCPAADEYSDMLDQFRKYGWATFGELLDKRRPPLVAPELAARIIATLPNEGEVKSLTGADRQKLDSLSAVLKAHGREQTYLLKVVDSRQARVGLHARFVVLVTLTALRILSPAQLQAIVAHEIGHEYVWDEYEAARRQNDWPQLRTLELYCDAVALVTLARIRTNPETLAEGLRLMDRSDKRNGFEMSENWYPTVAERAGFARQIMTLAPRWADQPSQPLRVLLGSVESAHDD